jgi:2-amino-4-hydroxy-6-hydroxymethyldihydropteridine diphosphokinase
MKHRHKCSHLNTKYKLAVVAVGSNMGNPLLNLQKSANSLKKLSFPHHIIQKSPVFQTPPVGYTQQQDFLNAVYCFKTKLPPLFLLKKLHQIEQQFQRKREIHWGPRTLDLDLIYLSQTMIKSTKVCIPHPRMSQRAFVLMPLYRLLPRFQHPETGLNSGDMLAALPPESGIHQCPPIS